MQPRRDTIGLWLRDVAVTLVLLFTGFAVAEALAKGFGWPARSTVYTLSLLFALIPTLLWLRYCGVAPIGKRVEVVTLVLLWIAFTLALDFGPAELEHMPWVYFVLLILGRPWVERFVERVPALSGRKAESNAEA